MSQELLLEQTGHNYKLRNRIDELEKEIETFKSHEKRVRVALIEEITIEQISPEKFQNIPLLKLLQIYQDVKHKRAEKSIISAENSDLTNTTATGIYDDLRQAKQRINLLQTNNRRLKNDNKDTLNLKDKLKTVEEKLSVATNIIEKLKKQNSLQRKTIGALENTNKVQGEKVTKQTDLINKYKTTKDHLEICRGNVEKKLRETSAELEREKTNASGFNGKIVSLRKQIKKKSKNMSVLENQLIIMDEKYISLRKTLDWNREQAKQKILKLEATVNDLKTRLMISKYKKTLSE